LLACPRPRRPLLLVLFLKKPHEQEILLRFMVSYYDTVKTCVGVKWSEAEWKGKGRKGGGASALSQNRRIATTIIGIIVPRRVGPTMPTAYAVIIVIAKPSFSGRVLPAWVRSNDAFRVWPIEPAGDG